MRLFGSQGKYVKQNGVLAVSEVLGHYFTYLWGPAHIKGAGGLVVMTCDSRLKQASSQI